MVEEKEKEKGTEDEIHEIKGTRKLDFPTKDEIPEALRVTGDGFFPSGIKSQL